MTSAGSLKFENEWIDVDVESALIETSGSKASWWQFAGAVVALAFVMALVTAIGAPVLDRSVVVRPAPEPQLDKREGRLAVKHYLELPGAESLRDLLESIGGLESQTLAIAGGPFDLLRFAPLDSSRILASVRSSYGEAESQDINEVWVVEDGNVEQSLWAPDVEHDLAHFNNDGTITMWVNASDDLGFGPRQAVLLDANWTPVITTSGFYASRFTSTDGKVFALTGDGDYYSDRPSYVELLVRDGESQTVLAAGESFGWIDTPADGLLVAYPAASDGVTAVWNTKTLEVIADHPLAGRHYQRLAISRDGSTAVGVTFGNRLEQIDLASGRLVSTFGALLDPQRVDQAVTLNHDGTIAITLSRHGQLAMWFVGEDEPIIRMDGSASQSPSVAEEYAPRSASVVAPDASRVALRELDSDGNVIWRIIETNVDNWVREALRD